MKTGRFISLFAAVAIILAGCSGNTPESPEQPGKPEQPEQPDKPEDPSAYLAERYAAMGFPSSEEDGVVRAFPGAEGGGMMTTGGRGGKVIHVTNLNDNGTGSLRAAILEKGPRTVVFDVAGIIELKSRLEIKNGDLTIAGQTAPGDGICLKGYNLRINTSNVIIRYIRCRMGDVNNVEDDAMNCYSGNIPAYKNVIVDHCSLSWSTDECGTFYGTEGFTLQYCIISESLMNSVHGKGAHGYAGIWGGINASFHHNLLAHNNSRNPRFDHDFVSTMGGPIHFYNNVVYNWYSNAAYGGEGKPGRTPKQINFVNNYYKPGPATPKAKVRFLNPTTKCSNCDSSHPNDVVPGKFYLTGNYMYGSQSLTSDNWSGVIPDDISKLASTKATAYQGDKPALMHSAEKAYEIVLAVAGASLRRDAVDSRVIRETSEGTYTYEGGNGSTGGIIDTQSAVGGWPEYKATESELQQCLDSDQDGIPDWFEDKYGLSKSNPSDAAKTDIDTTGRYSNLETYLHYLVKDITATQKSNN